jgi:hypothetical protein
MRSVTASRLLMDKDFAVVHLPKQTMIFCDGISCVFSNHRINCALVDSETSEGGPTTRREVFERIKHLKTSRCPFANLPESIRRPTPRGAMKRILFGFQAGLLNMTQSSRRGEHASR